ncbi:Serine/threonine-protein kinase AfsK [Pirellulimonas nuda]|uniref:Serine/threonine-protein kinase AfsK n=1 Tax=Pirellulimonas nuda TaxID=2528009 RepID=A0A518DIC6_9BACT|nr:PQQ-binding-like beta-propeller repeat protein [Pirellulimonas nuda]QDU91229.1 Serine/threonine-protein kinase AfsK [Pirellulimonas nuda]
MKTLHQAARGAVASLACLGAALLSAAWAQATPLTPESQLRPAGLERAWFTQTNLDAARNKLQGVTLSGDMLVSLSTAGFVEAFDAETGERLWATRVGNPDYGSLGPAVGQDVIALINGSTLHVLDRKDGRPIISRPVGGAPAGAPAIGKGFVFVPLLSGRVEGYPIEDQGEPLWYYSSSGRVYQPIVAGTDHIYWASSRGYMFAAGIAATGVAYRFESVADFVAPPAAGDGMVYAATGAGYMYAIDEQSGKEKWRYSTGFPILRSPVAIADEVFIVTEEPALHRVDASGDAKWVTPGVAQFIAQSESRVYGLDRFGGYLVLDGETGVVLYRAPSRGSFHPVLNTESDRLFVYSDDGLIQAFHELGADEPYLHAPKPATAEVADENADPAKPAAAAPAETPVKPAEAGPAPAEAPAAIPDPFGGEDPFGGDAGDPFGGDDPFGTTP